MGSSLVLPANFSNPLCPPWRLPSFESQEVQIRYAYAQTFTVAAGATVYNQAIPISRSSDFRCRMLAFGIGSALPGTIYVRFKDGNGRKLSADLLAVEELRGPVFPDLFLRKGTQVLVDIQNTGLASRDVQVILKGSEVYQRLGINNCMPGFEPESYIPAWAQYSTPPAGWHDEPFDYFYSISATALQVQNGIPLPMESDADFYWRAISGRVATGSGLLKLKFNDAFGNQLSSGFVLQDGELGVAPNARPILPEVVCPMYSTLSLDVQEYGNNTVTTQIVLRGVKRFKD